MSIPKKTEGLIGSVLLVLIFSTVVCGCIANDEVNNNPETRTITDMADRTIEIPVNPKNVLCPSPPSMVLVYMIAPDRLGAWNSPPGNMGDIQYIPEKYRNLPVAGGWMGTQSGNYETFISLNPDLILDGYNSQEDFKSLINERQNKFGTIPVVGMADDFDASAYDIPISFVGYVLGEEKKAEELNTFYHRIYDRVCAGVKNIPDDKRVTVYYAESSSGLSTDPVGSRHSQLIDICGGINVAQFPAKPGTGLSEVSIEQVITWAPEIIITVDKGFYNSVYENPLWKEIPAVKNNRVYLTPKTAFNWFDRPPGINRILGIAWCAKIMYPDEFSDVDLYALAKEFHRDYFHYELTDTELDEILKK
ncbi:MAG: ABC transporter substrate-binding protein [Methanomicrobiales archaeon]|jgi:iron complex transport system substrate-binding protein|nr:ABC transporter substrate-binding protein [Methanomicrobiales archaeon]